MLFWHVALIPIAGAMAMAVHESLHVGIMALAPFAGLAGHAFDTWTDGPR